MRSHDLQRHNEATEASREAVRGASYGAVKWGIATAMLGNIMLAGLAGVVVPLTLDRLKADPAVASSIFVTMTTDSMGFLVFLGLASASGLVG